MDNISGSDVAKRLLLIKEASESFLGFCKAMHPTFKFAPFQLELIDTLDKLEKGTLGKRQLLITMPPRHGKSTFASVDFPAYYMLRKATREILAVSYGSDLAATFGRQVRDATSEKIFKQIFPDFSLSPTSAAISDWMTTEGGTYFACGVGGGTTGRAANLLLIDDPIRNRADAESPTIRNKLWQFYTSSLNNRKQPEIDGTPPIEVLIQTRWHPDDLAGRIMESDDWRDGDWHHIDFPAIRQEETDAMIFRDQLPKEDPRYLDTPRTNALPADEQSVPIMKEVSLWPERFDMNFMEKMRRRDPREFAALYQQTPYIQGGNLVKTQWFSTYAKSECPENFHTMILAADTAFKTTTLSDFSVMMALAITSQGDIYILDVQRHKMDYPTLKRKFIMENSRWRGRGLRGVYIEDKASGQSILQDLRNEPGISVIPYKFAGARDASDKVMRINSVLPLIEGGRVFIPEEAPWLDDFLEEVQSFPASKHDDQVDALAMGLDVLSRVGINAHTEFPELSTSLNSLSSQSNMFGSLNSHSPDTDIRSAGWKDFRPLGEL